MKKIVSIIGARPQIIKSSALNRAVNGRYKNDLTEIIVHTGQHYDANMSELFFQELKISRPSYNLAVGSGLQGQQTAKMIEGLEQIYIKEQPDAVVIYGDTNSTIAGALAASKMGIPIIHIEAGLRSFSKRMPEEINRITCDHMSTLLFTPTEIGLKNLANEGFNLKNSEKATIDSPKIYHCGDIMYDNSVHFSGLSDEKSTILNKLGIKKDQFILATIHRDSNTDIAQNLTSIFKALLKIHEKSGLDIVLPIHPRTKSKIHQMDAALWSSIEQKKGIYLIEPVGFLDIIALEKNSRLVITDSGGLQKEAFFFQKPCVILREQTEWIELVENGNALLAGADEMKIIASFDQLIAKTDFCFPAYYGDGQTAEFICSKILRDL
jgi:UDP-GlcNAc3NAcA epimerase